MKDVWEKYLRKKRITSKGYLRGYLNQFKIREESHSNSLQQIRKGKEEITTPIQVYGIVNLSTEQDVLKGVDNGGNSVSQGIQNDSTERSGRNEDVQSVLLDMPHLPRKQIKRRRKAIDNQKPS